jgi:hypothetical protein
VTDDLNEKVQSRIRSAADIAADTGFTASSDARKSTLIH